MHTIRLLVCVIFSLPMGLAISRVSARFVTERPVFKPSESPRIAVRTLVIGVLNFLTVALVWWRFDSASWSELFAYVLGFGVLLLASVIDVTEYRLPDVIVLPALAVGVVLIVAISLAEGSGDRIRYALLGSVASFGVLLIAHLISPRGMGFGDVKFAALLGLMVGWQASTIPDVVVLVLWLFLIGFAIGTLGGVVIMAIRGRNQPFPFGPFLALGTLVTVLLSRALVG